MLLNAIAGHLATSKKASDFRCLSRASTSVLIESASIAASAVQAFGFFGSYVNLPENFVKRPGTLPTTCLALKPIVVWAGSIS